MGLAHLNWELPDSEQTLPKRMNGAGYRSVLIGMQHEHPDGYRLGYDELLPDGPVSKGRRINRARVVAPVAVDFIEEQARHPSGPWYACVGIFEPHSPWDGPEYTPDDPSEAWVPPQVYDTPEIRQRIAQYQGSIRHMDGHVGTILDALDRTGLAENTVLLFTTDRGSPLPRGKCNLYEAGISTSLLARWPGVFPAGSVAGGSVSNIDILPTLMGLAGADPPVGIEGRSFLPALRGESFEGRDLIFAEKNWHVIYDPIRSARKGRYKYIRNADPGRAYQAGPQEDNPRLPEALKGNRVPEELYDLQEDPIEYNNLVWQPGHEEVLDEMRGILDEWMRDTGDPLLEGPVAHPVHGVPGPDGIPTDIQEEHINPSSNQFEIFTRKLRESGA